MVMERRRAIIAGQDQFVPPEYQKYDYLSTNGYNGYFDTGVAGNDNSIQMDVMFSPVYHSGWAPILGNYNGTRTENCWTLRQGGNNKQLNYVANASSFATQPISVTLFDDTMVGKIIKVHLEYRTAKFIVGTTERTSTTNEYSDTVSSNNIFVGNYASPQAYGTTHRFYYFRVVKGGKLIRNYVPVVRKSDSKAGFWDTVNCTFNPSIGASEFTAGND